jgi:hypothetical protein
MGKTLALMGEGCQALATQELRRGWVRVKAVQGYRNVNASTVLMDSPSPTSTTVLLRSTKSTLPSPPVGGEGVFMERSVE